MIVMLPAVEVMVALLPIADPVPEVLKEPAKERSVADCKEMLPPVPPEGPPEVVIPCSVIPPVDEVIETFPPLLLPEPDVSIAPPIVMEALEAVSVNEAFPWMVELNESNPVPVWFSVVPLDKTTGPLKVAVVPLVLFVPPKLIWLVADTESEPVDVGPSVNPVATKLPPAIKVCDPTPLFTVLFDPRLRFPDVAVAEIALPTAVPDPSVVKDPPIVRLFAACSVMVPPVPLEFPPAVVTEEIERFPAALSMRLPPLLLPVPEVSIA